LTAILTLYFYVIISLQIAHRKIDFFLDIQSYLEMISILFNTIILVDSELNIVESETTVFYVFWAVIFMWFQFIYWFRLFDRTTLYVRLIVQTIYDMKWFFFIFVLVTMCFANAIYILNANRMQDSFGIGLFDETFPSFAYVSAILNQYLVALGDWDTENYEISGNRSSNSYLVWILFIFTTFFSQIVIFNILIAIMGDTYDSVFANMEKA